MQVKHPHLLVAMKANKRGYSVETDAGMGNIARPAFLVIGAKYE